MSKFLRVAKPVVVIAAVWSIGWAAVGLAFSLLISLALMFPLGAFVSTVINTTTGFAIYGFGAGTVFSIALALLEWGAPADELTKSRVALSGAIGGALFPTLSMLWVGAPLVGAFVTLLIFGGLGAATSLGLLKLLKSPGARASKPVAELTVPAE